MSETVLRFGVYGVIVFIAFHALIIASAVLVLAERKIMGFMQQRYGPYLVGKRSRNAVTVSWNPRGRSSRSPPKYDGVWPGW